MRSKSGEVITHNIDFLQTYSALYERWFLVLQATVVIIAGIEYIH